jgi:hypothetical protein
MNEYNTNSSSSSSLQQLIEKLENCISLESSRNNNPWVSVARLKDLFYKEYRVLLEKAVKDQGYKDGIKSFFQSTRCFAIYSTQLPQEFYVSVFQELYPGIHQSQANSSQHRIKQPWKADEYLSEMFKLEGTQEIPSNSVQNMLEYQPILVPKITSLNEFELALIEIIKTLTENDSKFITIAALSQKFYSYYNQPIMSILRIVCPDMKLIEIVQTIPSLHIKKVENDWHITIKSQEIN